MIGSRRPRTEGHAASNSDDVHLSASRRLAAVGFQEAAKPLLAANRPQGNHVRLRNLWPTEDRLDVERLMRPILVVVAGELRAEMVEVFGAEDDKMIQALAAKCLDKPLDVGVEIRRTKAILPGDDTFAFERPDERLRELTVAIMLHGSHFHTTATGLS